jgi:predicted amidohydrolase
VAIRNIASAMPLLLRPSLSVPRALLLTLAARMREVYVSTFGNLAARHSVYIAAGSILLPMDDTRDHRVYNRFFLFGPDGSIVNTAEKVNLIDLEAADGLDLSAGAAEALSVWRTPIGNFAPVICYDAWDAQLVGRLVSEGAQMLLVPSANPEPWSEQVLAERREGAYARVRELGVPGVEPFAVGSLAGLTFEGRSWILAPNPDRPDGVETLARAETAITPEIISATVALPEPASQRKESASDSAGDAL